MELFLQARS
uniref:Uncharacterized protein n=1 Tax=Rhizophora mucronata TaxID=61149 RepID=A0A2P2JJC8_RHIMU